MAMLVKIYLVVAGFAVIRTLGVRLPGGLHGLLWQGTGMRPRPLSGPFGRQKTARRGVILHGVRDGPLAPAPQSRPYSCIHSVTGSSHMKFAAALAGLALSVSGSFSAAFAGDLPDLGGKEITIVTENAYPPLQFID